MIMFQGGDSNPRLLFTRWNSIFLVLLIVLFLGLERVRFENENDYEKENEPLGARAAGPPYNPTLEPRHRSSGVRQGLGDKLIQAFAPGHGFECSLLVQFRRYPHEELAAVGFAS